jgi:predicted transcriptional regulator of viral defense system
MAIWYQAMKIKPFFEAHPVFRYEEFAAFMVSQGTTRPQSWRQQLSYHQKVGNLIHIRKFIYAVKPPFSQDQGVDPYLLASKLTADAILSYHTALELYGLAYTTFSEFTFLINKQIQPFTYEAQRFRGISQPKALINDGNAGYGIEEVKRAGMIIKLTSLERTLVDVLDRPDLGGGWEEIWRSLDNITKLDTNKVVEYSLLLKNATTVAKVGYFLEQRPSYLAANKDSINKLLSHVPKQPHYMSHDSQEKGKYIEKWQLIVPLEIINRSWEEPDVENI